MSGKQQVQINRMIEALEMIAEMPVWQEGVTLKQLDSQYEEARETARLAVSQFEAAHRMAQEGNGCLLPGVDIQRIVRLTEAEYLKLLRESGRGRSLACYILGRTEDVKRISDFRDVLEAVRGKCNEEAARG